MQSLYNSLKEKTLLIVEDDESTLNSLHKVLSLYFKEVHSASNTYDALFLFNKYENDIVLSDIQVPGIDGLSFIEKIKRIKKDTYCIVMTAFNNEVYLDRAVEVGISLYLKKPIDMDEILVSVASFCLKEKEKDTAIVLGQSYSYDLVKNIILKDNKSINLTKKELLVMALLLKNKDSYVSFEVLEQVVWQDDASSDAIRMVILGLRKKLFSSLIENRKGLGYRINLE
ncbi:MAG: response regulator transcription factor [Campylobacteraceae bacterium]|nr:response regulator transcription factor [Campylobacteraceae bacterium]